MAAITDPRVRWAIGRAYEKRARKLAQRQVREALERSGAASLRELMEATGLRASECGAALDRLKILGSVVEEPAGVFCFAGGGTEGTA